MWLEGNAHVIFSLFWSEKFAKFSFDTVSHVEDPIYDLSYLIFISDALNDDFVRLSLDLLQGC